MNVIFNSCLTYKGRNDNMNDLFFIGEVDVAIESLA
jgi:hypothetical protein